MSVMIKWLSKPKSCEWVEPNIHNFGVHRCPLLGDEDDCKLQDCDAEWSWEDQMEGCPLVEIPANHGRLIDADELSSNMPWIEDEYKYAHELIDNAPTVIEAEGE